MRVDPTPHSIWSMARDNICRRAVISNKLAIEKIRSLETFDIGNEGKVEVWNDDDALGLILFRHSKQNTGLFGWCNLTSWEISIAVSKVFDDDRHRALENIMSWLDYREPLTEPGILTSSEFCKWSLNIVGEHCDALAAESALWKNNMIAVDVVAKPINKNRIEPWYDRVSCRIGKGETWDHFIDENMFIVKYRYKNQERVS